MKKHQKPQAETSTETGDALQSERPKLSTLASPSPQPDSFIHEDGPTYNHKPADITNDRSKDLLDLCRSVPIKKYITLEDESFFEKVHIKSFNP